eukprot:6358911-Pyramimonas_sp.AAC.1
MWEWDVVAYMLEAFGEICGHRVGGSLAGEPEMLQGHARRILRGSSIGASVHQVCFLTPAPIRGGLWVGREPEFQE